MKNKVTFGVNEKESIYDKIRKAEKKLIKEEIAFLESDEIKWLIREADIGACHEDYKPIGERILKLKRNLK